MTTYVVGMKSFETIELAEQYAKQSDLCFVAIFYNGQFVSEHEVL